MEIITIALEITSFRQVKIAWLTLKELMDKINALQAKEILWIRTCSPECTDNRNWSAIYYEYYV
jgi:hypothetical protein